MALKTCVKCLAKLRLDFYANTRRRDIKVAWNFLRWLSWRIENALLRLLLALKICVPVFRQ
jgi:hypothetical protein